MIPNDEPTAVGSTALLLGKVPLNSTMAACCVSLPVEF